MAEYRGHCAYTYGMWIMDCGLWIMNYVFCLVSLLNLVLTVYFKPCDDPMRWRADCDDCVGKKLAWLGDVDDSFEV